MNCRRCGAELQQGMLVCPECGARQRRQARTVRCAYCHRLAPADLAVCPHCGRALRPLVPRPALWAVGLVVVVLAGMWFAGRLPLKQAWQRVLSVREGVASLVEIPASSSPDATRLAAGAPAGLPVATTAAIAFRQSAVASASTQPLTRTIAMALTPLQTARAAAGGGTPSGPAAATGQPAIAAASGQVAGTPAASAPAAGAPTAAPPDTATPQPPTATPVPPTATPAPPTATPDAVRYYTVQSGDTLIGIAAATGVDWQQIADLNNIGSSTTLQVGQKLRLNNPALGKGGGEPTGSPPVKATTYKVRTGDTLEGIGARFGLSWQTIADANKLNQNSLLHVDQELVIPGSGS